MSIVEILALVLRINAEGKYHVFFEYAPHVGSVSVRAYRADTDYEHIPSTTFDATSYLHGKYGTPLAELVAGLQNLQASASERRDLLKALEDLISITADGYGIAGYHQSEDSVARWEEYPEIGRARAAILQAGGEA